MEVNAWICWDSFILVYSSFIMYSSDLLFYRCLFFIPIASVVPGM